MKKEMNKELIISIIIPIIIGTISGLLSMNGMIEFNSLNKPSVAPPAFVFPIVWTILYALMGLSSYLIYTSYYCHKYTCMFIYGMQLFLNFMWSIIFFSFSLRLFALIWLIALLITVIYMIWCFYGINKRAAFLQTPYLLWLIFATYLNYMIYIMNR